MAKVMAKLLLPLLPLLPLHLLVKLRLPQLPLPLPLPLRLPATTRSNRRATLNPRFLQGRV